jgi:TonB-dependent SusC/RagA subfamily outer membrane receptor
MKKLWYCLFIIFSMVSGLAAQTTQDISSGASRTIFDLLRTIPGVEVTPNMGGKSQQQVYVRDTRNMKGKVSALIVLNGVIYDGDITMINPIDVASVSLLKDEAASSVYGSRGFGGVILITTKDGKGVLPAEVNSYEKSAYQYFISKGTELKIIGLDGKTITTGVISKETDSTIMVRKKSIHKKTIQKVEMVLN